MNEDWIDISNHKIKLLTNEMCNLADKIILLLIPNSYQDSEFTINWENPTSYLLKNFKEKIQVKEVQDPYCEWNNKLEIIRNEIKIIVKSLIMKN